MPKKFAVLNMKVVDNRYVDINVDYLRHKRQHFTSEVPSHVLSPSSESMLSAFSLSPPPRHLHVSSPHSSLSKLSSEAQHVQDHCGQLAAPAGVWCVLPAIIALLNERVDKKNILIKRAFSATD